jgi:hypothetical protein
MSANDNNAPTIADLLNIDTTDSVIDTKEIMDAVKNMEEIPANVQELLSYATEEWQYGDALIRDSYFVDYCKELLEDCGTVPHDLPWYVVVDWEKTADNMRGDYYSLDIDGDTYWCRNC